MTGRIAISIDLSCQVNLERDADGTGAETDVRSLLRTGSPIDTAAAHNIRAGPSPKRKEER